MTGFAYHEFSDEERAHIDSAIAGSQPICEGWVSGSWRGSVRPTFGPYRGHSMTPRSAIAQSLGFPQETAILVSRWDFPVTPERSFRALAHAFLASQDPKNLNYWKAKEY